MLKKAALFTTVALVAFTVLTGCTDDDEKTTVPAPSASAPAEPTAESEDPTGNLASVGDGADWDVFIAECADADQEPVVQEVVTGDVTGDGTADALVARTCDASTSYYPSTVEVFDGATPAAGPTRLGTMLTDVGPTDQPWVVGLAVTDGAVTIQAYGTDSTDSNACPKLKLTYRYQLKGGTFERLDRTAAKSATCLPIE